MLVVTCLGRDLDQPPADRQGRQDTDLAGRRGPGFSSGDLVVGHGVGVARVGPVERQLELGLDDLDRLGVLGFVFVEDDVGARGCDGALLLAAQDRVGHERVELFGRARRRARASVSS